MKDANFIYISLSVPAKVSAISAIGTTNSMTVSWTKAEGRVSSYIVQLNESTGSMKNTTELSNETTNIIFEDLKPGVLFDVKVVTKSGPKESNISVSNATCEFLTYILTTFC